MTRPRPRVRPAAATKRLALTSAALLSVLAAACSSSGDAAAAASATATPEPTPPPVEVVDVPVGTAVGVTHPVARAFIDAFASDDPDAIVEMIELAATGSPAATYAQVQSAIVVADTDAEPVPATVERDGAALRLCTGREESVCFTYADFVVADDGLVSFTIDGLPLGERTARGGATVADAALDAELAGAYRAASSGILLLAIRLGNRGQADVTVGLAFARYRAPEGPAADVGAAFGARELAAGSETTIVLGFDDQPLGGLLDLSLSTTDLRDTTRLRLPVTELFS